MNIFKSIKIRLKFIFLIFITGLFLLIPVFTFSGCSNKPNLKEWSKATAAYLLSKKFPKEVNTKKKIWIGIPNASKTKMIDNYNIGIMKFGKIISCYSNRSNHAADCWYTINFIPNKNYYKVKEKLLKDHCIIHKTGEAQALFQQTVNKKWYIYVLQWQWNKYIVQWHYPY